jgi:hypothetical protein
MRREMCSFALAVAFTLSGTLAQAQDAPPPRRNMLQSGIPEEGGPPPFDRMELLGIGGGPGGPVVTGAPFCATSTTTQTLADGKTTITRTGTMCRDANGRVSTEMTPPGGSQPVIVIRDPGAHKLTLLRPDQKVAYVSQMRNHGPNGPGSRPWIGKPGANIEETSLGTKVIGGASGGGGLNAEGKQYTRKIPASQISANQDIVSVSEQWYCTDWKVMCMTTHTDPWSGTVTHTLSNFQSNVDPARFTVPQGYTVKEGGPRRGMRRFRGGPQPADAPAAAPPSNEL